jgi:branched-chain amino acid transport system substrate-binding protein
MTSNADGQSSDHIEHQDALSEGDKVELKISCFRDRAAKAAKSQMNLVRGIVAVTAFVGATSAMAQDGLRIGFISTFTGAQAMLGQELLDGFKLGVQQSGGSLGGIPTQIVVGDDQGKPDIGRQLADKMVTRDKVQIVTGVNFTNVLLAISKPVLENSAILFSVSAGPSQLAGKQCNSNFFSTSWQNDGPAEAMGAYFTKKGINGVYVMAPNFPGGKDVVNGFKRFYKGTIKKEVFTQLEQLDYAAEIAEIRSQKPSAVFYFYPGVLGINFLKQYADSGLSKTIPLYSAHSLNETILRAAGDTPLGSYAATFWTAGLKNPENQQFVAAFEKAYGRTPSDYAMQSYDAARVLDSALKQFGGKMPDTKTLAAAIRNAPFKSIRGNFKFNKNGFPIQDYDISRVEKNSDGKIVLTPVEKALTNHADEYVKECPLS